MQFTHIRLFLGKRIFLPALAVTAFATASLAAGHEHSKHSSSVSKSHSSSHSHTMESGASSKLIAVIRPTAGNDVSGVVTFEKAAGGIKVSGEIRGLTPGKHGFHVHEYGDLSASDGTSAGGHFNPDDLPHGGPEDERRHVGDLGNITANEQGIARFRFIDEHLAVSGRHSIVGRGLIIHAGRDDLTSQPTGAAGARVGMAVIGIANTE